MKNSIIAGHLATELVAEFNKQKHLLSVASAQHKSGSYEIWLHAKRCSISGKPSGGLRIWGVTDIPVYANRGLTTFKRLKTGWNDRDLYRHAADIAESLRQQRTDPLIKMREKVFKLAESREFDADNLPRESSAYEEMNEDECRFWLEWLSKQILKIRQKA